MSIGKKSFPNLLTIFTTCLCLCSFTIDRLITSSSVIGGITRLSGDAELLLYHGTIMILSTTCLLQLSFTLHSQLFIGDYIVCLKIVMHADTSMTRFMMSSFFTLNSNIVQLLLGCNGYQVKSMFIQLIFTACFSAKGPNI